MTKKEVHSLQHITSNISGALSYLRKFIPSRNENDNHRSRVNLYIVNKKSGKCIDVKDAQQTENATIHQWVFDGTKHKKWHLEPLESDYWRIVSFCDLCLEVRQNRDIGQGRKKTEKSQKWVLNEMNGGVKISSQSNLDLCLGISEDGTIILTEPEEGEDSSTIWLLCITDSDSLRKTQ